MQFNPNSVLTWYKARPKWQKVALSVVLIILLLAAGAWWVLCRIPQPMFPSPGLKEHLDEEAKNDYNEALERDEELKRELDEVLHKREEVKEGRETSREERDEAHAELDDANSISDIRDAINNAGTRRRRR